MGLSKFQLALTAVTVTGSILSCLGTAVIILSFFLRYYHSTTKPHFRHKLILNLAIADFLNSLNNSLSGLFILATQSPLSPGIGCTFNGFITQVTVQATDCAVLAISIVTVYSIVNVTRLLQSRDDHHRLVVGTCISTWMLPVLTGTIALFKHWYTPVSGNWCWIQPNPVYLRYLLTHGWRFLFVMAEIVLYSYLFVYSRRMNAIRHQYACSNCDSDSGPDTLCTLEDCKAHRLSSCHNCADPHSKSQVELSTTDQAATGVINCVTNSEVNKIMLLNAYPLGYIILWIPGILNRIVEATGQSSRILQFCQASTQFVGLANALTYGVQTMRTRRYV